MNYLFAKYYYSLLLLKKTRKEFVFFVKICTNYFGKR